MNMSRPIRHSSEMTINPVRILLIGDRERIEQTIAYLCILGFCERLAWSDIIPHPDSSEYMSIMTKK